MNEKAVLYALIAIALLGSATQMGKALGFSEVLGAFEQARCSSYQTDTCKRK